MAGRLRRQVLSEQIYDILRDRITTLEFPPGKRIDIAALCRELDVSPIPIREALKSLKERHLVESIPNVGYHTTMLTDQDVREIFRLRRLLEGDAIEAAIRAVLPEDILNIKARNEMLLKEKMPFETVRALFDEADMMLHRNLLVGGSGNNLLIHFYDITSDMMRIVMRVNARIEASAKEHIEILDALIDGDLQSARSKLWEHLGNVETACLPLPRTEEQWLSRRMEVIGR